MFIRSPSSDWNGLAASPGSGGVMAPCYGAEPLPAGDGGAGLWPTPGQDHHDGDGGPVPRDTAKRSAVPGGRRRGGSPVRRPTGPARRRRRRPRHRDALLLRRPGSSADLATAAHRGDSGVDVVVEASVSSLAPAAPVRGLGEPDPSHRGRPCRGSRSGRPRPATSSAGRNTDVRRSGPVPTSVEDPRRPRRTASTSGLPRSWAGSGVATAGGAEPRALPGARRLCRRRPRCRRRDGCAAPCVPVARGSIGHRDDGRPGRRVVLGERGGRQVVGDAQDGDPRVASVPTGRPPGGSPSGSTTVIGPAPRPPGRRVTMMPPDSATTPVAIDVPAGPRSTSSATVESCAASTTELRHPLTSVSWLRSRPRWWAPRTRWWRVVVPSGLPSAVVVMGPGGHHHQQDSTRSRRRRSSGPGGAGRGARWVRTAADATPASEGWSQSRSSGATHPRIGPSSSAPSSSNRPLVPPVSSPCTVRRLPSGAVGMGGATAPATVSCGSPGPHPDHGRVALR